jgi:hypothetical protein
MNRVRTLTTGTTLAALAATGLILAPASAAKGVEARSSGKCSIASTWKLKAKADNGRIEVEYEVDSNRVGQTWSVRVTDDGVRVATASATTTAPSGSFELARRIVNTSGTDTITAIATYAPTGEVCRGTVVFPG